MKQSTSVSSVFLDQAEDHFVRVHCLELPELRHTHVLNQKTELDFLREKN